MDLFHPENRTQAVLLPMVPLHKDSTLLIDDDLARRQEEFIIRCLFPNRKYPSLTEDYCTDERKSRSKTTCSESCSEEEEEEDWERKRWRVKRRRGRRWSGSDEEADRRGRRRERRARGRREAVDSESSSDSDDAVSTRRHPSPRKRRHERRRNRCRERRGEERAGGRTSADPEPGGPLDPQPSPEAPANRFYSREFDRIQYEEQTFRYQINSGNVENLLMEYKSHRFTF